VISLAAPQSGQNVPSNRTSRATGSSSVPYQPRGALRLIGCVRSLAKQPVVIGMGADPEPHEPVFRFHGQGAVVGSNPSRPEATDLFEVERRVPRVLLQARVCLVGEILDVRR